MKTLIIFALLIKSSFAGTFQIIDVCENKARYRDVFNNKTNVFDLSLLMLEKSKLPYSSARNGIYSILNTPIGEDALEVVSSKEMRAYGWCYTVDGVGPEIYPNDYKLKGNEEVLWYFGFAHYLNGEWVSQCEPVYRSKPEFICSR